jgi:hypothetical protein
MRVYNKIFSSIVVIFLAVPSFAQKAGSTPALWREPDSISSRNLYFGPGGKQDEPHGKFTFKDEDLDGTSPKFNIRDEDGVSWKVKLGAEPRPETVATRLVWAMGYFTGENYFMTDLHVENMGHLKRGHGLVSSDGTAHNARLKRHMKGEEKIGTWKWSQNPFSGTREFDGLRVMMALINNWDLKDINNAIYEYPSGQSPEKVYMVSDLGASFGATGDGWPSDKARGNLQKYAGSKFIRKVTPTYVDFNVPTRPAMIRIFTLPEFIRRLQMRWIGKQIPRDHVRWAATLLAQLSPDQIRDSFRAAGYSPEEVEGFTKVVQLRIEMLKKL